MKYLVVFVFIVVLQLCTAPPVTQKKPGDENANENEENQESGLVSSNFMFIKILTNLYYQEWLSWFAIIVKFMGIIFGIVY